MAAGLQKQLYQEDSKNKEGGLKKDELTERGHQCEDELDRGIDKEPSELGRAPGMDGERENSKESGRVDGTRYEEMRHTSAEMGSCVRRDASKMGVAGEWIQLAGNSGQWKSVVQNVG